MVSCIQASIGCIQVKIVVSKETGHEQIVQEAKNIQEIKEVKSSILYLDIFLG